MDYGLCIHIHHDIVNNMYIITAFMYFSVFYKVKIKKNKKRLTKIGILTPIIIVWI